MLTNQGITFCSCLEITVIIVFATYPMHINCIYLVPSISRFHIVYFCGMYVPVKMQMRVFIFNLQYM